MTVYDIIENAECQLPANAAVALGNFDGVHMGHQALFRALSGDVRAVFTFADLYRADGDGFICSLADRLRLIGQYGVRYAVVVSFAQVRDMTPEQFCRMLTGEFGIKHAVCGENFRFGAGAVGDAESLRRLMTEQGARVTVVEPVKVDGETVSSTAIRHFLSRGETERAALFLGRPYSLRAPVIHGRELGRTIGFPTVNQTFPAGVMIPRSGVYAARVEIGGETFPGVCNIGVRPTVADLPGDSESTFAETHIIGCDRDLYGQTVEVELVKFLRPERKFPSVADLRQQIGRDIESVKEIENGKQ